MNRTICLTRIHALNWYGYKDTIPVEGNLLLAGVTGSGKSILMDLIQFVLVGDQRLVRFNQSATGDRGDRSIKGYCLGDTKEEENGVTQYMRARAITYVALEFTWPNGKKSETWGIRVEFASAAEAHGKITPFFIPESLARGDFLDAEKCPLDYTAFKAFAEGREGRIYPEGIEAYLRDMAQPVHLNFDKNVLRSLLPTAMSFTFLKSFNEFARQFILPADKLDVNDVTASYRTFLGYERDLNDLNDQFERLKAIRDTFTRLTELRRDRILARYLEAQLRNEHAAEQLQSGESRLSKLKEEYATEEARLKYLEEAIPNLRQRIDGIKASVNETPEGRLYSDLKSRNEKLTRQISQLTEVGATLGQALANRVRNARSWLKELRALALDMDSAPAVSVERAIHAVEQGGVSKAGETLRSLGEAAQRAAVEASRAAAPTYKRLSELRQQLGQLRDEVAALKIGKLPFPTKLLDALNNSLLSRGSSLPAQHLRALCEITDERWRPAIEIALARKFAIIVSPENYEQAEKIYHGLKASDLGNDTSRESLINPAKALKLRKTIRSGSLAEKLKTGHPVAEAVVSHLFGDLMCVESLAQLRALLPDQNGILADGFMIRGAFVERPRFYDGNPFVGEKGLEQQLAWKQKMVDDLEAEERKLMPIERAIKSVSDGWREHFEQAASLSDELASARRLPELQAELKENIAKLKTIDRAKFDELATQQTKLEAELKKLEDEQRALDRSEKRAELRQLESQIAAQRNAVTSLAAKFEQIRNEVDVSPWLKRLDEFRFEVLGQFPVKDAAANRFNDQFHELSTQATGTWEQLKAKRRELAMAHSKFDDLPVETETNDAHDKQLAKLEQSDIPDYRAKAERERKNWEHLFRTQILEKLHNALNEVVNLVTLLNTSLKKRPIGTNTYELRYWRNRDYQLYHDLLQASAIAREDDLFFASAEPRFRDAIAHFLKTLTEQPDSAEASRLLDYRHYYEYDMEVAEAQAAGILSLVPVHKRDRSHIHQVRFSPANEPALYARIDRRSPTDLRAAVADQFGIAVSVDIPARWREHWKAWCERMRQVALTGGSIAPFDREPTANNTEMIVLLSKLLAWEGESLVRFASCVLCGDSKQLEQLAAFEREGEFSGQLRGKLGRLLEDITGNAIRTLDDIGIIPNPRSALVHGPLRLCLAGVWLNLGLLHGPFRLSQSDIERAESIETTSLRCLTIENETTFHELAKLQSGDLLVCTSFPGSGTVALLKRLPPNIDCWHFGDSDEAGFEILRVLRRKSSRNFRALHMQTQRIPFEQESLGRPKERTWPYY